MPVFQLEPSNESNKRASKDERKAVNLYWVDHQACILSQYTKVSKGAKIRNRCNQVPHLTQVYQIIVSSIKFRKGFAKFMIPIALFKKFLSYNLLLVLKSAKWLDALAKRMRDIDSIGCRARNITIKIKGKFTISKSKSSRLS